MIEVVGPSKSVPQAARQAADGTNGCGCNPAEVWGVVLAGVHAWGDCALESLVCRPLLPIASRPLIRHILEWIRGSSIRQASVCGNSDTGILRRNLGTGEAVDLALHYSEDEMPRGPAGCVRDAALATGAQTVLVVDGTVVPCLDATALLRDHARAGAAATLVVGAAEAESLSSGAGLEPVGIYVFSRSVLERIPGSGYQDIKESLLPALHRRGERILTHVVSRDLVPRVTDPASYLAVNMWAVERMVGQDALPSGFQRVQGAWVESAVQIDPQARMVGPVLIGAGSVVHSGAVIVGPTTIGVGSTIGPGAVVSCSAVWDRCRVGSGSELDHCIVTNGASIEAQSRLSDTVYVPPRRRDRGLFGRVVSYCRPLRRGGRGAGSLKRAASATGAS